MVKKGLLCGLVLIISLAAACRRENQAVSEQPAPTGGSAPATASNKAAPKTSSEEDLTKPPGGEAAPTKQTVGSDTFPHLAPNHRLIVMNWLKSKPELRPAMVADYDRAIPQTVELRKKNSGNHPYYVVGDFSGDGKEDFAVILRSKKSADQFWFAIFNASFDRENPKPAIFERCASDLVFQLNENNPLYLGPYNSDNGVVIEPNGKTYRVSGVFDEED